MEDDQIMGEIVLCVPGRFGSREEVEALVPGFGFELEPGHDDRMVDAFAASAQSEADAAAFARIGDHTAVVYLLSGSVGRDEAESVAEAMLSAACALLDAGGLGVKCESSGTAHTEGAFRALAAEVEAARDALAQDDLDEDATLTLRHKLVSALYDAYVERPIADDHDVYTCGMHLLGAPDVVIAASAIASEDDPGCVDASDLDAFALYVLAEPLARAEVTFRTTEDAPAYAVSPEPCTRYPDGDEFMNPLGYLRLTKLH